MRANFFFFFFFFCSAKHTSEERFFDAEESAFSDPGASAGNVEASAVDPEGSVEPFATGEGSNVSLFGAGDSARRATSAAFMVGDAGAVAAAGAGAKALTGVAALDALGETGCSELAADI